MISFDMDDFMRQHRDFLDHVVQPTLDQTRSAVGSRRAQRIAEHIFPRYVHELVDRMLQRGGEEVEPLYADHYFAAAVAAWLSNRRGEADGYYRKATEIRTGGNYNIWADAYMQG